MGWDVKVIRVRDRTMAHIQLGDPSKVGLVSYPKTLMLRRGAECKAETWHQAFPV